LLHAHAGAGRSPEELGRVFEMIAAEYGEKGLSQPADSNRAARRIFPRTGARASAGPTLLL